jgi:hypothetical protein
MDEGNNSLWLHMFSKQAFFAPPELCENALSQPHVKRHIRGVLKP